MEENSDKLYGNDKLGWFKISEKEENYGLNIKWLVFFVSVLIHGDYFL